MSQKNKDSKSHIIPQFITWVFVLFTAQLCISWGVGGIFWIWVWGGLSFDKWVKTRQILVEYKHWQKRCTEEGVNIVRLSKRWPLIKVLRSQEGLKNELRWSIKHLFYCPPIKQIWYLLLTEDIITIGRTFLSGIFWYRQELDLQIKLCKSYFIIIAINYNSSFEWTLWNGHPIEFKYSFWLFFVWILLVGANVCVYF